MHSLSDIDLMLIILIFLALFYVGVALLYKKIRVPKAVTHTSGGIPTERMDSPAGYAAAHGHSYHQIPEGAGNVTVHVAQPSQPLKTGPRPEPSQRPPLQQPLQLKGEEGKGTASYEKSIDKSEETVKGVESSMKEVGMTDESKEESCEKLEAARPAQIEISEKTDIDGSNYHMDFEEFFKTLMGLRDAVDELKRRISNEGAVS
ncbi:MAG: hypothetical protein QXO01_03680 [Nitrososphaerota archaeon]